MDVQKKLDEIAEAVGSARSMPMSASCVVNRAELLALLDEVREALPGSLAQAAEMLGGHEEMAEQARAEAERIVAGAQAERDRMVSGTEVARRSQAEADRILAEARREAEEVKAEADDYVDSKLANFEVVLTKTIGSVDRGREKLLGRGPGDPDDAESPEYSADPSTLIQRADGYVDAKLGAFEAVLSKTLEAVGRGRQKLHGRIASDDLGSLAALGSDDDRQHTSDADFLAGLAEQAPAAALPEQADRPRQPAPPAVPQQQPYTPGQGYDDQPQPYDGQTYGGETYGGQGYGYPQDQSYAGQSGYGYPQQYAGQPAASADPYAVPQQDGYGGYDPYAYPQDGTYGGQGYGAPTGQQQPAQQGALDETSFFDTGMIDMDRLREYEQGR
ncbi:cell division initiation protein [Streptomyces sp. NPDC060194]|uniref:ATP synthase F0 subunit B n=1 Tax=Streptomyces sp. NPDC060194 TaxID=3347069 RepID=UPI00364760D4